MVQQLTKPNPHLLPTSAPNSPRANEAVGLQASSGKKAAAAKADRAAKKAAPTEKKTAIEKAALKAPTAKMAKKSTPIKKAAKNRAAKKTAPAPVVQAATKAAAQ